MELYLNFVLAHPWLFAAAGLLLALMVANELHGHLTGATRLSTAQAVRFINDREPLILDVRPVADYKRGHLAGAVNVPLAKLEQRMNELNRAKDAPVLVYCNIGGTASEASRQLLKRGHSQVFQLSGGINAWLGASLPVTTK